MNCRCQTVTTSNARQVEHQNTAHSSPISYFYVQCMGPKCKLATAATARLDSSTRIKCKLATAATARLDSSTRIKCKLATAATARLDSSTRINFHFARTITCSWSRTNSAFYLGCHCHECLLNVCCILCARLKKWNMKLVSVLLLNK